MPAGDSVAVKTRPGLGMLSASEPFRAGFVRRGTRPGAEYLQVGELTVWIEGRGRPRSSPRSFAGLPPEQFHIHLQDTLTRIHAEQADAFDRFEGDASIFPG